MTKVEEWRVIMRVFNEPICETYNYNQKVFKLKKRRTSSVKTCRSASTAVSNSSSWMFQSGIIKKCCRENPVCPASAICQPERQTRSSREAKVNVCPWLPCQWKRMPLIMREDKWFSGADPTLNKWRFGLFALGFLHNKAPRGAVCLLNTPQTVIGIDPAVSLYLEGASPSEDDWVNSWDCTEATYRLGAVWRCGWTASALHVHQPVAMLWIMNVFMAFHDSAGTWMFLFEGGLKWPSLGFHVLPDIIKEIHELHRSPPPGGDGDVLVMSSQRGL